MTAGEITPALVREDARGRVAKTAGQVGVSTAVVVVGQWVAHQAGWGGTLPVEVSGAMVTLLSTVAAWVTNLARLRAV